MKIAIVAPIVESIPPKKYGGTERVVHWLTEGLVKRGHEVTLFASGDSKTSAKLKSLIPKHLRQYQSENVYRPNVQNLMHAGFAYSSTSGFDIIHDHFSLPSLPTANMSKVPVLVTWHGAFDKETAEYFSLLNKPFLTGISESQISYLNKYPKTNLLGKVYNGLNFKKYKPGRSPENFLLFAGRIDPEKGPHLAIEAAVKLKMKLVIAAKYDSQIPHIKLYFEKYIKPKLKLHRKDVKYIGELSEESLINLFQRALCTLHPTTWPEPFGLTIVQAMASGCPVIANNLGSIPEIIEYAKTGYVVKNMKETVRAIKNIHKISRQYCHEYSVNTFSDNKMVTEYEKLYNKILNLHNHKKNRLAL
ncbi:MAG: glycosyltransferase family 4 protein [Candidatus Doudnabacteria bacterium]|nr:glycosyltransferase family 4 protein [Candidatus Doudnabacteria bacterium]